jgi:F420-dependent oxidoreductase-like protein
LPCPTDYYEQLTPGVNPVDYLLDRAHKLAELGVPAVWLTQRFDYDALAVAALIGREIPDITVGTAVVPIHPRHPNALAMQAQTAQAASRGRFELGLGLSLPGIAAGYGNTHPRIRYLREYLTALRELLHTGTVDHTGETLVARSSAPSMMPTVHPPVPILLATSGPLTLQVAAELADGALPLLTGPNTLADFTVPILARHAAAAGRPIPRVISVVGGVVTADVADARERAAQQMNRYGEMPAYRALLKRENISNPVELAIIGDEQTMADAVTRYADAGADELIFALTAVGSASDEERTWALLGELSKHRRTPSQPAGNEKIPGSD